MMLNDEIEFLPLRPVRVRSNGKREYAPADKRRLIALCLSAGTSVSGMALKAGINANQLRKRIRQKRQATQPVALALSPFVPIQAAVHRGPGHGMTPRPVRAALLGVKLPNCTKLELSCGPDDAAVITTLVQALWAQR
jgi:transposase